MKILLQNVRYLNPGDVAKSGDIAIVNGCISALGKVADFQADHVIDGTGLTAIPGMTDLSARLREPGQTKKGSIYSETMAAVAGGFSAVCLPPDTMPVIDNPAVVELVEQRQLRANFAKVLPLGAITEGLQGEKLANMGGLVSEGCVGVSHAMMPFQSLAVLRKSLEYAVTLGITVHLHPYHHSLAQEGIVHAGATGTRLGLPGISTTTETVALAEILLLVKETGASVHLCRLSTAESVAMVRLAKQEGVMITADVSMQQLFYTDANILGYDSCFHVLPPLRSKTDLKALRAGLLDGTIDAICSDHQPHDNDAKLQPFSETEIGMSTVDGFLPQLLQLCQEEKVNLADVLGKVTCAPAKIAGQTLPEIKPGAVADIMLLALDKVWQLTENSMLSQGANTPLLGQKLIGQNQISIVGGKIVFDRKGK